VAAVFSWVRLIGMMAEEGKQAERRITVSWAENKILAGALRKLSLLMLARRAEIS